MKASVSEPPDYYRILDVPADATEDEIILAYYRLRKHYRPYLSAQDPAIRKEAALILDELQEAFDVLSDDIRRWLYDQQPSDTAAPPRSLMQQQMAGQTTRPLKRLPIAPPPKRGWSAVLRRMFVPQARGQEMRAMGVVRKMLLLPIPFCVPAFTSTLLWQLGQGKSYQTLFEMTAILSYPFLLFILFFWLAWFVRFRPILNPVQKTLWSVLIVLGALLLSWVWIALADHNGQTGNPLDIYFWLVLIMGVSLGLAYL